MLSSMVINFRQVSLHRHSKKLLESKHGILRFIFFLLRDDRRDDSPDISAVRALRFSNDLYGSQVLSSYEMSKVLTHTVGSANHAIPIALFDEVDEIKKRSSPIVSLLKPSAPNWLITFLLPSATLSMYLFVRTDRSVASGPLHDPSSASIAQL